MKEGKEEKRKRGKEEKTKLGRGKERKERTRTSRSFKVSNWDILKLRSWPQKCANIHISTLPVFLSFMKFCVSQTFFGERHLDVVLGVLQVVG